MFSIIQTEPFMYNSYLYPWYGELIGWAMAFSSVGLIPIYAAYKILTNKGPFREVFFLAYLI